MKALGRHVLVELHECDVDLLNNVQEVETIMRDAAQAAGATIVNSVFHHFSPFGVSGVVVIAESHLAIHTWPEFGYAAVDLFTCGESVNPWVAHQVVADKLKAKKKTSIEMKRGVFDVPVLKHKV